MRKKALHIMLTALPVSLLVTAGVRAAKPEPAAEEQVIVIESETLEAEAETVADQEVRIITEEESTEAEIKAFTNDEIGTIYAENEQKATENVQIATVCEQTVAETEPELNDYQKIILNMTEEEAELFRKILYAETCGEPFDGVVAAAQVVLNRVLSDEFPGNVYDVLTQGNGTQFNGYWHIKYAKPGEMEDDAISYIADGGELPLARSYVYFSTKKVNGKHFIQIGKHWFSE